MPKPNIMQLMGEAQMNTQGKGRDDDQLIRASKGEYVIPADIVAALGDGNTEAGAEILDNFVARLREYVENGGIADDSQGLPI